MQLWTTWATILCIVVGLYAWLDTIKDRWYIFNHKALHELSKEAIALHDEDMPKIISHIVTNLAQKHGTRHINVREHEWVFNNAGGAMGAMYIIHASITEYVIIFGTPLGTEGHSGRHTADNYFNILKGEQWAFSAGELAMQRYPAGTVNYQPRGTVKQYKMHKGCWALEYSRGWIPPMLLFGFADFFSSTLDMPSLWITIHRTAREMIRNLLVGKI